MEHPFDFALPPPRFAFREDTRPASAAPLFVVIERDHRLILRLLEAIAWYAEDDDERRDLFDQLRWEALAHLRAEEEVTYPSIAALGTIAFRHLEEHRELDAAVERIAKAPIGGSLDLQLDALRAGLQAHVRNHAKGEVPPADQVVLGRVFEAVRNRHLRELGALS